jgi:transcriptional regulator with XRE-family HTH domain
MTVNRNDLDDQKQLGAAIREFRQKSKLTQAQLAVTIGIAPTSVYRYEAGSSSPDVGALQRLFMFADREKNEAAKRSFFEALCAKTGVDPRDFQLTFFGKSSANSLSALQQLRVKGKNLTPKEQLLTIAFILMIRNNTEDSSDKMMRVLLEPWMNEAKSEYDNSQQKTAVPVEERRARVSRSKQLK